MTRGWRRWAGYRSDLVKSARLATDEVGQWGGYAASASLMIAFRGGMTQRSDDLAVFESLDRTELQAIRDVTISVSGDREAWSKTYEEAFAADEPRPPIGSGQVTIRLWQLNGMSLSVEGEDRTSVEGLFGQLVRILERGAPRLHRIDMNLFPYAVGPLAILAAVPLGALLARALGLAEVNGRWEPAEIAGMIVLPLLVLALVFAIVRTFPAVEVLDEGELPRSRRLRNVALSASGALVIGILGTFLYEWFA